LSPDALAGGEAAGNVALGLTAALLAGAGALLTVFVGTAGVADWLDLAAVFTVWGVALGAGWTFTAGLAIAWAGAWVFLS
jgi:hypothetical protein